MSEQMESEIRIEGAVAAGFEPVRDAFERNFSEHGDCGASLAIYVDGEQKVDLWGGLADPSTGAPWTEDTLGLAYSVTKGATATLVNLLVERGELDLDAPVARYWPEFAAAGKADITVRMVLSHQAGLPVIDARLTRDQLIAGEPVVEALADQAPLWKPGSSHGYHALTFGWLVGEIVRRATGRPLGELFREQVAEPLALEFFIGCPASEHSRIAKQVNAEPPDPAVIEAIEDPEAKSLVMHTIAAMMDPESLLARALSSNGELPAPEAEAWGDPRIYSTEQPAANGITNGRSLARMYAACVTEVDGCRLLSEETVAAATAEQSAGPDELFLAPSRFGVGYMLPMPMVPMLSSSSFGHSGAGGALGFADRDAKLGFGYVQNQLGSGLVGEPRTEGLIAALQEVLSG